MSDAHASQKRIKCQYHSFIVSPGNCITSYLTNFIIELSIIIVYVSMITGLHKKINVYLAKHINIVRPNEIWYQFIVYVHLFNFRLISSLKYNTSSNLIFYLSICQKYLLLAVSFSVAWNCLHLCCSFYLLNGFMISFCTISTKHLLSTRLSVYYLSTQQQ